MLKFILLITTTSALNYEVKVKHTRNLNFDFQSNQAGEYVTTVFFGTPSQAIGNMVFDTGSSLSWVKNSDWY